jgi:hypothetical protein
MSDYAYHAVKGVKESFDLAAAASILEYKDARIFNFEDTQEWTEIFNATEGMTGAKELADAETPPTLDESEGYQVSLSSKRYGAAIELTETDLIKAGDSTVMIDTFLQRKRNDVLTEMRNYFLEDIFTMLNDAFDGTYFLAPDGIALCGTHVYKATSTTFDNAVTTVFGQDAIDDLEEYGGAFQDAFGKPRPITFDTIIVKKGSDAAREAKKLFGMYGMTPTAVADINIYEGQYTLIETPYITSTNKKFWFAVASREKNPLYVGITKMPSMNEPIKQNNEAVRSNVTGYWKRGINSLPIGFYGSNGSA